MAEHKVDLSLPYPWDKMLEACQHVSGILGWPVIHQLDTSFSCKQIAPQPLGFGNPVTIEISLQSTSNSITTVSLKSRNFGFGPLQNDYVKKCLHKFRATLENLLANDLASTTASPGSRAVVINGVHLSDDDVSALERAYRTSLKDGTYWYDRACGAWGIQGGPTLGFLQAGLAIGGALQSNASNGDTGVFINGRQLHRLDVVSLQQLGPVLPGRYWVDAMGNFGFEGGLTLGNLWMLARQRQATNSGSSGGAWAAHSGNVTVMGDGQGGVMADDGNSFWST